MTLNQVIATSAISNLVYTPSGGYAGADSFGWNGSDGIAYATSASTVNITIDPAWLATNSAATWNASTQTLTVTGSTTIIADPGNGAASNVIINASGNAALVFNAGGSSSVFNIGSLSLTGNTTLDVGQNIVRLGNTLANPVSAIQSCIFCNQIISSALTAGYGLAYGNVTVGNSSYTEFRYTIKGDAQLTGTIGVNDLSIVLANYGQSTTQWQSGNFEYNPAKVGMNNTVNINDLSDVLGHYGITMPSSIVAASVRAVSAPALASAADNDSDLLTIDGVTDQPLLGVYDIVS